MLRSHYLFTFTFVFSDIAHIIVLRAQRPYVFHNIDKYKCLTVTLPHEKLIAHIALLSAKEKKKKLLQLLCYLSGKRVGLLVSSNGPELACCFIEGAYTLLDGIIDKKNLQQGRLKNPSPY